MDLNRLTQKSQEAIHDAQTKALRHGHTEIDVEHLLLALVEQADGLVPRLLVVCRNPARAVGAQRDGGSGNSTRSSTQRSRSRSAPTAEASISPAIPSRSSTADSLLESSDRTAASSYPVGLLFV